MRIRRFTAGDMTEALRQVRETLGPEAVILETKKASGRLGRGGKVMVVAAVDRHPATQPDGPPQFGRRSSPLRSSTPPVPAIRRAPDPFDAPPAPGPHIESGAPLTFGTRAAEAPLTAPVALRTATPAPPMTNETDNLRGEVDRLRARIQHLNRLVTSDHFSAIPIPLRDIYLSMVEAEVDSNLAFALLRDLAREERPGLLTPPSLEGLRQRLLRVLPAARGVVEAAAHRVVLLAGPTSSGKTTVAAGLAARALARGRRPALVSADAFRAAGASALESYAGILEVPFATAFEPADLTAAAARSDMAGCDLLIVDSPGAGGADEDIYGWIRSLSEHLAEPAVHLVLPATSKAADGAAVLERFAGTDPEALIFTMLDETRSYGGILSLALKSRLPVSYLGFGRNILTDLHPAEPRILVDLVVEQCAAAAAADELDPRHGRGSTHVPIKEVLP